jgi:Domain of unknown function (DUF4351)
MPYITSTERLGRLRGRQSLMLEQLTSLVGEIPATAEQRIQGLSQESLRSLGLALLKFRSLNDLEQWLAVQPDQEEPEL